MELFVLKNSDGQTFVEFLFLLLTIVLLAYGMLKVVNINIADRWTAMIETISSPTETPIEMR